MPTPIDVRDLFALRVAYLAELPVPCSLALACAPLSGRGERLVVWLTTSRQEAAERAQRREPVFTPLEFEAIALGVQEGRAGARDFRRWAVRKVQGWGWRLSPEEAVDGAVGLLVEHVAAPRRVLVRDRQTREPLGGHTFAEHWRTDRAPPSAIRLTVRELCAALEVELVEALMHDDEVRERAIEVSDEAPRAPEGSEAA